MIGFSMIYITSAIAFYRIGLGDASLVYANIVNLSVRIMYSLRFVARFFSNAKPSQPFHLRDLLPSYILCIVCAISNVLLSMSERHLNASDISTRLGRGALLDSSVVLHIGLGAILALTCVLSWWRTSSRHLALSLRRGKTD